METVDETCDDDGARGDEDEDDDDRDDLEDPPLSEDETEEHEGKAVNDASDDRLVSISL